MILIELMFISIATVTYLSTHKLRLTMLKNFNPRLYQEAILNTAARENTLVVLPTGLGKTAIALMLAVNRLSLYSKSKVVFLAPTRPLVQQHFQTFQEYLDDYKLELFTGNVSPEKRAKLWDEAQIIFSTPQSIENDLISSRLDMKNVSLIIFDEAHRAIGDYSYNFIAKNYWNTADYPRILGLTASPGSDFEKISEVCGNLYIENIEVRTDRDPDVNPYVQEIKTEWVEVELPKELLDLRKILKNCINSKIIGIKHLLPEINIHSTSKGELLAAQSKIRMELLQNKDFERMRAVSILAEIIKIEHAIELLESQSITALTSYMDGLWSQSVISKTKALQNLIRDRTFKQAYLITKSLSEKQVENPKIPKLIELIKDEIKSSDRIIVFNHFRDTATKLIKELRKIDGAKPELFVGQAKRKTTGMTQKEQKEMIERFRNKDFNILVSTSIGEEGLDIPNVGSVIFYEPVPSAIRHIQRRGRTGRVEKGKIIILVTKDTRDVGYRWSAYYKEKRMYRLLEELKKKKSSLLARREKIERFQTKLSSYETKDDIKVYVDAREKGSAVMQKLQDFGVQISIQRLEVSDYLISEKIGIEYKTTKDFVNSIIDGRLLQQVKNLKDNLERPLIIVEGEDIYNERNIHPNAIRGMLATIAGEFNIPVLFSKDVWETAFYIYNLAKKEKTTKDYSPHSLKPGSITDLQEYIVAALPGIGLGLAKSLLRHFGSIRKIVEATERELMMVDGIGHKKSQEIRKLFDEEYNV